MIRDMTNKQIKQIAIEFRRGMLGKRKSQGMCAAVSWALQGYLSFLGVETFVHEGDVGDWNHVWLVRRNGDVIDATADQFSTREEKLPKVYVGRPLAIHKTNNGKFRHGAR
jgi:hypothetical protein